MVRASLKTCYLAPKYQSRPGQFWECWPREATFLYQTDPVTKVPSHWMDNDRTHLQIKPPFPEDR